MRTATVVPGQDFRGSSTELQSTIILELSPVLDTWRTARKDSGGGRCSKTGISKSCMHLSTLKRTFRCHSWVHFSCCWLVPVKLPARRRTCHTGPTQMMDGLCSVVGWTSLRQLYCRAGKWVRKREKCLIHWNQFIRSLAAGLL